MTLLRAADDIVDPPPRDKALERAARDLDEHKHRVMLVAPPDLWVLAAKMVDTATEVNADRATPKENPGSVIYGGADQALMNRYTAAKIRFISAARRHIDPDAGEIEISEAEREQLGELLTPSADSPKHGGVPALGGTRSKNRS